MNDAPVASNQSVTTDEDTAKAITLSATDVEGSPLTYAIQTGPAPRRADLRAGSNYNGSDSFTFKANDGLDQTSRR